MRKSSTRELADRCCRTELIGDKDALIKHILTVLNNGGSVFTQDASGSLKSIRFKKNA